MLLVQHRCVAEHTVPALCNTADAARALNEQLPLAMRTIALWFCRLGSHAPYRTAIRVSPMYTHAAVHRPSPRATVAVILTAFACLRDGFEAQLAVIQLHPSLSNHAAAYECVALSRAGHDA